MKARGITLNRSFVVLMALVLAVGLPVFGGRHRVFAHANLSRAEPAPDTALADPPQRVAIWFTEPLEPAFSEVRVLDARGRQVDNRDSAVDRSDRTAMTVTLPPLPEGVYTVAWKNLSAVDGHSVRGSYVFSIRVPISSQPAAQATSSQPLLQSKADPVFRWLALLGVLSLFGGLAFSLLIVRPVLKAEEVNDAVRQRLILLTARTQRVLWLSAALFLLASVGQLLSQAAAVKGVGLFEAFSSVGAVLTDTAWGDWWLRRIGLLAAAALALAAAAGAARKDYSKLEFALRWLALGVLGGILFTISWVSHAAATPGLKTQAVFSDYVHLLAAAFWVGGLFQLALGLPLLKALPDRERREVSSLLVPRFSVMAVLSVGALAITGLYSSYAQVTALRAATTPYGYTLIAKLLLIVPLLALAALNLLWVRPRLTKDGAASGRLRRFVVGEAALAALALLAVGMLTGLEPARQVASRQEAEQGQKLVFTDNVESRQIKIQVEPGTVGYNQVLVSLKDRLGKPVDGAAATLRLTYQGSDIGSDELPAHPLGDGLYHQVVSFGIAGSWQLGLLVQSEGAFDARAAFRFDVISAGAAASDVILPSQNAGKLLWGGALALMGLLFLVVGFRLTGLAGAGVTVTGAVGAVVGLFWAGVSLGGLGTQEAMRNPFPPNAESIAIGQSLYTENCVTCHGVTGKGDGPGAVGLNPPPLDLRVHVPLHPERDLFRFIKDGIPDTAMPVWDAKLSDDEIWHLVNYLQTLADTGAETTANTISVNQLPPLISLGSSPVLAPDFTLVDQHGEQRSLPLPNDLPFVQRVDSRSIGRLGG
ncbi:MAG: copper resistance protein CopC [Chloroflexi bacterium]|nr:copper resistance protein CopC [Chloroflexota bacterium]